MEAANGTESNARGGYILVVDDDPATRRMVTRYFEEHDFPASSAAGRQDLSRQLQLGEPSLILLDLRLGQEDGLDLLREIRSSSDVPVIITTGHRLDEIDRVVGLELGADDYVTKPFGLRELLARVRAVLRRRDGQPDAPTAGADGVIPRTEGITFGNLIVSPQERRVLLNGSEVALRPREFDLLTYL